MDIIGSAHIDRAQWEALVKTSPTASWFQTPEAFDFYCSLPAMMKPFVVGVMRDQALKGVVVGYVTTDSNRIKQFFTRRAIIYGGPLFAEDISDEEVTVLLAEVKRQLQSQAIYVETRNFVSLARWNACFEAVGFAHVPHYDMYIDCSHHEKMIALIHDTKRRQIRKAEKDGVTIVEATTAQEVHDYYVLLRQLYRHKVRRPLFAEDFFQRFVADKRGVLLLAKLNETVIGGILCPVLEGKVIYEWYVVGPAMVTWAAMDYANKHHIPMFDLMGAGKPSEPYGVRAFKQQFGARIEKRGRFLCVNNKLLYGIGKIGVALMNR